MIFKLITPFPSGMILHFPLLHLSWVYHSSYLLGGSNTQNAIVRKELCFCKNINFGFAETNWLYDFIKETNSANDPFWTWLNGSKGIFFSILTVLTYICFQLVYDLIEETSTANNSSSTWPNGKKAALLPLKRVSSSCVSNYW